MSQATVFRTYCNMLCSFHFCASSCACFLSLTLTKQIPAVTPSALCKQLPIRLCCKLQRLICAAAPPLFHQLLGAAPLPPAAGSCEEQSTTTGYRNPTQGATVTNRRPKCISHCVPPFQPPSVLSTNTAHWDQGSLERRRYFTRWEEWQPPFSRHYDQKSYYFFF